MKNKALNFQIKELMVNLAGSCFWFWAEFHSFLRSSGVSSQLIKKFPQGVYSKYDVMRNILDELDSKQNHTVIQNIVSNFYRLKAPIDKVNLDINKAKLLLQEFREAVGNDPIERAVEDLQRKKKQEEARRQSDKTQSQLRRLTELHNKFLAIFGSKELTPQKKGYELEKMFYELLELEEFDFSKPYRKSGEQIDGHFKYEKFDYLVEIKWKKGQIKQPDLSIFDGKIRGKAQSTRGFFLAMNGFDDNAVQKYSGDNPRMILMDGQELTIILEGRRTFFDCLKYKVDAIVRLGDIYKRI